VTGDGSDPVHPLINYPGYAGWGYLPTPRVCLDDTMSTALTTVPDHEPRDAEFEPRDAETITSPEAVQSLMDVLTDADCRAMLAATSGEAHTTRELSEEVDLPLSTTYRKVDQLTDVGVLAEQTRFDSGGSHPSEYRRVVEDVVVSVAPDDGATLTVTSRPDEASVLAGRQ